MIVSDTQIQRLREVRVAVRDDCGICWPHPDTGTPMIGTGHCHDTCYEAETEQLRMTGGWFLHPADDCHYEHSWLTTPDGVIVDPTADQWHLPDLPDVAVIDPHHPLRDRYITCAPIADADELAYAPPADYRPGAQHPPSRGGGLPRT